MDARDLFLEQHGVVHSADVGGIKAFTGRPRRMVLSGIGVIHSATHLGEVTTVRAAGGFGTGV